MRRVAKKRRYVDNTVKGTRRGSRWPEETKTGAMCDLLVGNNLSAVARKYGVPESTLRTWMSAAHKLDAGGRKSLFDQERERQIRALDGIDLAVEKGKFTAVIGPSGAGKSTLFHLIAGLDEPTEVPLSWMEPKSPA